MSTTAAAPAVPVDTKNRTNFLSSLIGRPVLIKLFSGAVYHGILASIDGTCFSHIDNDLRQPNYIRYNESE